MLSSNYNKDDYDYSNAVNHDVKKTVGIRISDLEPSVGEYDLNKIFGKFGGLHSVRVIRDQELGTSLGYGYANYYNIKSALQARQCFHNMLIKGKPISVKFLNYEYSAEISLPVNRFLHINHLDYDVEEKTLWERFSPFGIVNSIEILPRKGASKLKAVIEFKYVKDATAALNELDGMPINGIPIKISYYLCLNNNKKTLEPNDTSPSIPYVSKTSPFISPISSPSVSTNILIVTGILPLIKNIELNILFDLYGEVLSCRIESDSNGKLHGLVEFRDEDQAKDAKEALDGKFFRESKLKVNFYDPNSLPLELANTECTLKISNLNPIMTEEHLKYVFEPYGTITNSSLIKDDNDEPVCFGYLTFSSIEETKRAKKAMSNKMISGKFIKVDFLDFDAIKKSTSQTANHSNTFPVSSCPKEESTRIWNFPYKSKTYTDYDGIVHKIETAKQENYTEIITKYKNDTDDLSNSLQNISLQDDEKQKIAAQLRPILVDKNPNYANELLQSFLKNDITVLRRMMSDKDDLEASIDAAFNDLMRDLWSD